MAVTRRSLGKPIVNAPVGCNAPRLNGIVGASNLELPVQGFVPILRDLGSRRLHCPDFVRAARHQHTLFPVPVPMEAKSSMRHSIGGRPKISILPTLATIGRYLDAADSAGAG